MAEDSAQLRVALVSPFDWGIPSAVNQHVAGLALALKEAGHRPVVVASSSYAPETRRMRPLLHRFGSVAALLGDYMESGLVYDALRPLAELGPLAPDDGIPVITMGRALPLRANGAVSSIGLPGDITSRMDRLLSAGLFDILHIHEPAAPSLSFGALRLARSPVIATFHLTPLGLFSYEHGRNILRRFYPQIDRRIVFTAPASATMHDFFGGDYRVIPPATALPAGSSPSPGRLGSGPPGPGAREGTVEFLADFLYLYRGDERRSLRLFLRYLAAGSLPDNVRLLIGVHRPSAAAWPMPPVPRSLVGRVSLRHFDRHSELAPLYRAVSSVVLPFLGGEWLAEASAEAAVAGLAVVAPAVPALADLLAGPTFIFSPDQEESLRRALVSALESREGAAGGVGAGALVANPRSWSHVLPAVAGEYRAAGAARRPPASSEERPGGTRPRIDVRGERPITDEEGRILADLHIHTAYSGDSTSSVEAVLAAAREVGLGALAIADHNTIRGALLARERAAGVPDGLMVIVAEEVKTKQGEVIGLFLEEEIPAGLGFDETLSRIKAQGGLVYIPHPFDSLHSTPSYRSLADNAHRIDVVETFNARLAFEHFNVRAERFAAKYNLVAGAGSDAHVLQGIGTAMVSMRPFAGPEDFMESLRDADILTNRKSVVYLTALKRMQTTLDRMLLRI